MYCTQLEYNPNKWNSDSQFRFGDSVFNARIKFNCRLGLSNGTFLEFEVFVVDGYFPLLMGLEVMRQFSLVMDWGRDLLAGPNNEWKFKISYAYGHAFVHNHFNAVIFTRAEVEKLHLHFHHPSSSKLLNLIRRNDPTKADSSVKKILEEISAAFEHCQEYSSGPLRFRASITPDELVFNQELAIDLLWLNKKPVIHFVDTHTNYQNAAFVATKSSEELWKLFMNTWVTTYVGYPSTLRLDRESAFESQTFRQLPPSQGIVLQFSGVKSHNSIRKGEKYHDRLRRIFNKIKSS